jgi:hypothetical protein
MISTFLKSVVLMAFFAFSTLVVASQFNDPYQGNVMVESFDEKELKEMALKQVLVKVSGNTDISSLAEAKLLLKNSQQLISQYGYRTVQGTQYYSAVFDKRKINQSLKDMQQPVWGDTRPTTLIWLIHNNELVSDNTIKQSNDASLSWSLQQTERRRGIQIEFPLMDLDDNLALSVSDVRGRFYDQVADASVRYARTQVVVAELNAINSEKWKLNWQLIQTDIVSKQHSVLLSEQFVGDKSSITKKMINALADYYASQYAIIEKQDEKFTQILHINGINSLAELAELNSLFKNLLAISSFTVVGAEGERVSVEVKIKGGLSSFKNALTVQPHLQLDSSLPLVTEIEPEQADSGAEINAQSETLLDKKTVAVKTEALYFNWR